MEGSSLTDPKPAGPPTASELVRKMRAGRHDAFDLDVDEAIALAEERDKARDAEWRTWGIIEIAVRNPNVLSYMEHWEGRATRAEAENARLRTLAEELVTTLVTEGHRAVMGDVNWCSWSTCWWTECRGCLSLQRAKEQGIGA